MIGAMGAFDPLSYISPIVSGAATAAGGALTSAEASATQHMNQAIQSAGASAAQGASPVIQSQIDQAMLRLQAEERAVEKRLLWGALGILTAATVVYLLVRK